MAHTGVFNIAEVLEQILYFLAVDKPLYPTLFVNRFWYYTAGQILWKHIELNYLGKFLRICKDLKPFHGVNVRNIIFPFSPCELTDGDIDGIIGSCPNIVYLNFNATCRLAISDTAIINIAHSYPNLLRLELFECGYISDRAIKEIANSCHKLEHFDVYGCGSVTDSGIRAIARSCPKLKYLDLGNNSMIGNSAIREIARSCHNLKFLGLEWCSGISRKVVEKLDRNIKIEWPDSDSDNDSVSDPEK